MELLEALAVYDMVHLNTDELQSVLEKKGVRIFVHVCGVFGTRADKRSRTKPELLNRLLHQTNVKQGAAD